MPRVRDALRRLYLGGRSELLRRLPSSGWTDAPFHKLIEVDPAAIRVYQDVAELRHKRLIAYSPAAGVNAARYICANAGKVLDGDWDRIGFPFEENAIHRLLREHFIDGVPWQETVVWAEFVESVERGVPRWHNCRSVECMVEASARIDDLYRSMRDRGYLPGTARGGCMGIDEVTISIGRDGSLLYSNLGGHHRLSIARILGIEAIPVRVLLRHRAWQEVRDGRRSSRTPERLPGRESEPLDHPDLADAAVRRRLAVR